MVLTYLLVSVVVIASVFCITFFSSPRSEIPNPSSRRLQFEGMFDVNPTAKVKRFKFGSQKAGRGSGPSSKRITRPNALASFVDDVILGSDRYHLWWSGPPEDSTFKAEPWGNAHSEYQNAIFTMAVVQGGADKSYCTSPNDYRLFLGSARRVFTGDIVIAVESSISDDVKAVLKEYRAVVYTIPDTLCSRETSSIFCGSADERVPASVFRYYFYERWAAAYSTTSNIMLADFRDIIFQSVCSFLFLL